ncbi:MAG TPA: hypothetical protein VGZ02_15980 [Candidatus Baltobacteraceae bacterium]|nr:hypothetical protein [Candidatus Baltobacteraceae bacterium]
MPQHSPSVLIVRLDAIGDAMTLVPLIAALRSRVGRIGALLTPANAGVFSKTALDRRHVAGPNLRVLASEIEARRYDYAFIATEKPAGYRIAKLARIPNRIGFENGWGKPFKTLWVRRMCTQTVFRTAGLDLRAPHECEVVFSLARTLMPGAEPSRDPSLLRTFVLDSQPAKDERIAFQVTDKWIRLGASFEDVLRAAAQISESLPVRWIGAQSEQRFISRFQEHLQVNVDSFGEVAPWKDAIAAARAVIAPDSGAVHIAGMIGTPVAACFAGEHFALQTSRWAPWAAPSVLVQLREGWPAAAADAVLELVSGTASVLYRG